MKNIKLLIFLLIISLSCKAAQPAKEEVPPASQEKIDFLLNEKIYSFGDNVKGIPQSVQTNLIKKILSGDHFLSNDTLMAAIEPKEFIINNPEIQNVIFADDYFVVVLKDKAQVMQVTKNGPEIVNEVDHEKIENAAITANGRFLITQGGGIIQVIDLQKNEQERVLYVSHYDEINISKLKINITPNGRYLTIIASTKLPADPANIFPMGILSQYDNSLEVIDLHANQENKVIYNFQNQSPLIYSKLTPDGKYLVVYYRNLAKVVDLEKEGEDKAIFDYQNDTWIYHTELTFDGRFLIVNDLRNVKVIDLNKDNPNEIYYKTNFDFDPSTRFLNIRLSSDDKYLYIAWSKGTQVLDIYENKLIYKFSTPINEVYRLSVSSSGKFISRAGYYVLDVLDVSDNKIAYSNKAYFREVGLLNDGRYIIVPNKDGIKILDFSIPENLSLLDLQLIYWLYRQKNVNKVVYKNENLPINLNFQQTVILNSLPIDIRKRISKNYNLVENPEYFLEWLTRQDKVRRKILSQEQLKIFRNLHPDVQRSLIQEYNLKVPKTEQPCAVM